MTSARRVVVLGATGSVGAQAADVIAANPERFTAEAISASGSRPAELADMAIRLGVHTVGVALASHAEDVILHLRAAADRAGTRQIPKVLAGPDSSAQLAQSDCDVVLNAITGSIGLDATVRTLQAGTTLALANKESLVAGGRWVRDLAADGQIRPVDSEHSAMAQCLAAGRRDEMRRIILTASGGPFRGRTREQMRDVTVAQALNHPTWNMGSAITLNSATLVNKGLELIEAHLLFDVAPQDITVVVHPQSIVHSMVEYVDGSTIAQLSAPDMRLPIALALGWPERVPDAAPTMDWSTPQELTFELVDDDAFPAVALARQAAQTGGWAPAAYNAANEVAAAQFLAGRLGFLRITDVIQRTLDTLADETDLSAQSSSYEDVIGYEQQARARAQQIMSTMDRGKGG